MKLAVLAIVSGLAVSASADLITQWNFNSIVADANTGTGTTSPSIGLGTASLFGGVTAIFASGDASGGSSDPATGDDSGWGLTTWAAQGTGSGTRGAAFAAATSGYENIVVTFDARHSNTFSKFIQAQYSLDGSTFTSAGLADGGILSASAGDVWTNGRTVDLSGIAGVANNANFAFRVVAIFAPGTSAYQASTTGSNYGTAGTFRLDMVTISGTVPTPGSAMLLGMGSLLVGRRRR